MQDKLDLGFEIVICEMAPLREPPLAKTCSRPSLITEHMGSKYFLEALVRAYFTVDNQATPKDCSVSIRFVDFLRGFEHTSTESETNDSTFERSL